MARPAHCIFGTGCLISATNIHSNCVPANLEIAFIGNIPNNKVWKLFADKEYDGLKSLDVYKYYNSTISRLLTLILW